MPYKGDVGLYLSGEQVVVPMSGVYITQPTVRQIVQFGETQFFMGIHLLVKLEDFLKSIKEGNSELGKRSDFQILLEILMSKQTPDLNQSLDTLFQLITPDFQVVYKKTCMEFHQKEDGEDMVKGVITSFNFEDFQAILSELFISTTEKEGDFNPANEAAKKIADKLRAARDKKAQKSAADKASSVFGIYASILSVGLQMDINTFYNYKPFQLYDTFSRFLDKQAYDMYQRAMSIPFADTSKLKENEPKSWMRDLYV